MGILKGPFMLKNYTTTKVDFELFKKECEKWIEVFGLKGWSVVYCHDEKKCDNYAEVWYNLKARCATITLIKKWGNLFTGKDFQIKQSAFHEARELFYARINLLAKARYVTEYEIDEEIHNLIRNDENLIFKCEVT